MLGNDLEAITLADLQALVTHAVPEGKSIEYKRDFYNLDVPNQQQKVKQHEEMLKDISSFANTVGGDLIIGIDENKGIPKSVCGFETPNPDALKLRITQIAQSGIEPRVAFTIKSVEHSAGRYVFVIRVLPSMVAPHRVVYQKSFGQFYARTSSGAHQMDTSELRRSFNLSETIYDRIRTFRTDRVKAITAGETPVTLTDSPKIILHLIPQDSYASRLQVPVDNLQHLMLPLIDHGGSRSSRFNMDGMVMFDRQGPEPSSRYVQIFRNGIIESLVDEAVFFHPDDPAKKSPFFATYNLQLLIQVFPYYLKALVSLGISPPVWCFLTMTGMQGVRVPNNDFSRMAFPIDRDIVFLPELEITNLNETDIDTLLRPLYDMLWNASGERACTCFNQHGKYHVR
jgi:hypothetical protein